MSATSVDISTKASAQASRFTSTLALSPAQRRQRSLALLLLFVVIAMAAVAAHALWWQPWQAQHQRAGQAADRLMRAQALIAQREPIAQALDAAETSARQQPLWLPETTVALAIDGMAQRIDQAVAVVGDNGQRCKVQSRNPAPDTTATAGPTRATLSLRLRCGNAELLQLLYLLESSQPPMLVDELNISAPPQYPGAMLGGAAGVLDVSFNVSGFVQPAMTAGAAP